MKHPRFSADAAKQLFARLLRGGRLHGLPTRQTDLELVLAVAAAQFIPRHGYTEREVNTLLRDWLPTVLTEHAVDHVTVRRYLVDYRLLRRDSFGNRYQLGDRELDEWLTADARTVDPAAILAERARARAERRATHERQKAQQEEEASP